MDGKKNSRTLSRLLRPANLIEIYKKMGVELLNIDCMEYMREVEDNHFDLAIVDPPYREAKDNRPTKDMRLKGGDMLDFGDKPDHEYFAELFRVSKNQIIWGANNFLEHLRSTNCFVFWDKKNDLKNFSDGEMAWTSYSKVARKFEYIWVGNKYGFPGNEQGVGKPSIRIHPTEKPVALYEWLLTQYFPEKGKVLDTHLGSGSHAVAAHKHGYDFVGCEINKKYYDLACERFERETSQQDMFASV